MFRYVSHGVAQFSEACRAMFNNDVSAHRSRLAAGSAPVHMVAASRAVTISVPHRGPNARRSPAGGLKNSGRQIPATRRYTMARFGVEGISSFASARAAGYDLADLPGIFDISDGLDDSLSSEGHERIFNYKNKSVWETDIKDDDLGGYDNLYADNVDLFLIATHGGNSKGQIQLYYDTKKANWVSSSGTWRLGEAALGVEWLMAYACTDVNKDNVQTLKPLFRGLHLVCCSWGSMWIGTTTDECGEDVGDNLTDGETVSYSWIDGVSDWSVDNKPIVIGPCTLEQYNDPFPYLKRFQTSLYADHLWNHGPVTSDFTPGPNDKLNCLWAEG
jgi:hypothetical protein